jgi:hypothetical protein
LIDGSADRAFVGGRRGQQHRGTEQEQRSFHGSLAYPVQDGKGNLAPHSQSPRRGPENFQSRVIEIYFSFLFSRLQESNSRNFNPI